jgi:hypothetical protein
VNGYTIHGLYVVDIVAKVDIATEILLVLDLPDMTRRWTATEESDDTQNPMGLFHLVS